MTRPWNEHPLYADSTFFEHFLYPLDETRLAPPLFEYYPPFNGWSITKPRIFVRRSATSLEDPAVFFSLSVS